MVETFQKSFIKIVASNDIIFGENQNKKWLRKKKIIIFEGEVLKIPILLGFAKTF